ncbi:hypothetical protein B0T10DRAFT_536794 [Thelonectria olida]|uniref:LysM domain-containing protein n=1 Tax=Thelonectria olida TaxID=1576542 RepID=A0A9P8W7Y6_9HYPO|nr:hypothetical protein B0T10DRAFT_536794 [Thelonectria olida]
MKPTVIVALGWGLRLAAASPKPELQWDLNTISTCVECSQTRDRSLRHNTCESIRSMFGISAGEFHQWNPSAGTDCKLWRYQPYCILIKERLANDDPKIPVLENLVSPDSKALQAKNCESKCWQLSTSRNILYPDCNTPCTGNRKEMCGGRNRISVFKPSSGTVKNRGMFCSQM